MSLSSRLVRATKQIANALHTTSEHGSSSVTSTLKRPVQVVPARPPRILTQPILLSDAFEILQLPSGQSSETVVRETIAQVLNSHGTGAATEDILSTEANRKLLANQFPLDELYILCAEASCQLENYSCVPKALQLYEDTTRNQINGKSLHSLGLEARAYICKALYLSGTLDLSRGVTSPEIITSAKEAIGYIMHALDLITKTEADIASLSSSDTAALNSRAAGSSSADQKRDVDTSLAEAEALLSTLPQLEETTESDPAKSGAVASTQKRPQRDFNTPGSSIPAPAGAVGSSGTEARLENAKISHPRICHNASLAYFKVAAPLNRPGLRTLLLDSLPLVCAALALLPADERPHPLWLAHALHSLASAYAETPLLSFSPCIEALTQAGLVLRGHEKLIVLVLNQQQSGGSQSHREYLAELEDIYAAKQQLVIVATRALHALQNQRTIAQTINVSSSTQVAPSQASLSQIVISQDVAEKQVASLLALLELPPQALSQAADDASNTASAPLSETSTFVPVSALIPRSYSTLATFQTFRITSMMLDSASSNGASNDCLNTLVRVASMKYASSLVQGNYPGQLSSSSPPSQVPVTNAQNQGQANAITQGVPCEVIAPDLLGVLQQPPSPAAGSVQNASQSSGSGSSSQGIIAANPRKDGAAAELPFIPGKTTTLSRSSSTVDALLAAQGSAFLSYNEAATDSSQLMEKNMQTACAEDILSRLVSVLLSMGCLPPAIVALTALAKADEGLKEVPALLQYASLSPAQRRLATYLHSTAAGNSSADVPSAGIPPLAKLLTLVTQALAERISTQPLTSWLRTSQTELGQLSDSGIGTLGPSATPGATTTQPAVKGRRAGSQSISTHSTLLFQAATPANGSNTVGVGSNPNGLTSVSKPMKPVEPGVVFQNVVESLLSVEMNDGSSTNSGMNTPLHGVKATVDFPPNPCTEQFAGSDPLAILSQCAKSVIRSIFATAINIGTKSGASNGPQPTYLPGATLRGNAALAASLIMLPPTSPIAIASFLTMSSDSLKNGDTDDGQECGAHGSSDVFSLLLGHCSRALYRGEVTRLASTLPVHARLVIATVGRLALRLGALHLARTCAEWASCGQTPLSSDRAALLGALSNLQIDMLAGAVPELAPLPRSKRAPPTWIPFAGPLGISLLKCHAPVRNHWMALTNRLTLEAKYYIQWDSEKAFSAFRLPSETIGTATYFMTSGSYLASMDSGLQRIYCDNAQSSTDLASHMYLKAIERQMLLQSNMLLTTAKQSPKLDVSDVPVIPALPAVDEALRGAQALMAAAIRLATGHTRRSSESATTASALTVHSSITEEVAQFIWNVCLPLIHQQSSDASVTKVVLPALLAAADGLERVSSARTALRLMMHAELGRMYHEQGSRSIGSRHIEKACTLETAVPVWEEALAVSDSSVSNRAANGDSGNHDNVISSSTSSGKRIISPKVGKEMHRSVQEESASLWPHTTIDLHELAPAANNTMVLAAPIVLVKLQVQAASTDQKFLLVNSVVGTGNTQPQSGVLVNQVQGSSTKTTYGTGSKASLAPTQASNPSSHQKGGLSGSASTSSLHSVASVSSGVATMPALSASGSAPSLLSSLAMAQVFSPGLARYARIAGELSSKTPHPVAFVRPLDSVLLPLRRLLHAESAYVAKAPASYAENLDAAIALIARIRETPSSDAARRLSSDALTNLRNATDVYMQAFQTRRDAGDDFMSNDHIAARLNQIDSMALLSSWTDLAAISSREATRDESIVSESLKAAFALIDFIDQGGEETSSLFANMGVTWKELLTVRVRLLTLQIEQTARKLAELGYVPGSLSRRTLTPATMSEPSSRRTRHIAGGRFTQLEASHSRPESSGPKQHSSSVAALEQQSSLYYAIFQLIQIGLSADQEWVLFHAARLLRETHTQVLAKEAENSFWRFGSVIPGQLSVRTRTESDGLGGKSVLSDEEREIKKPGSLNSNDEFVAVTHFLVRAILGLSTPVLPIPGLASTSSERGSVSQPSVDGPDASIYELIASYTPPLGTPWAPERKDEPSSRISTTPMVHDPSNATRATHNDRINRALSSLLVDGSWPTLSPTRRALFASHLPTIVALTRPLALCLEARGRFVACATICSCLFTHIFAASASASDNPAHAKSTPGLAIASGVLYLRHLVSPWVRSVLRIIRYLSRLGLPRPKSARVRATSAEPSVAASTMPTNRSARPGEASKSALGKPPIPATGRAAPKSALVSSAQLGGQYGGVSLSRSGNVETGNDLAGATSTRISDARVEAPSIPAYSLPTIFNCFLIPPHPAVAALVLSTIASQRQSLVSPRARLTIIREFTRIVTEAPRVARRVVNTATARAKFPSPITPLSPASTPGPMGHQVATGSARSSGNPGSSSTPGNPNTAIQGTPIPSQLPEREMNMPWPYCSHLIKPGDSSNDTSTDSDEPDGGLPPTLFSADHPILLARLRALFPMPPIIVTDYIPCQSASSGPQVIAGAIKNRTIQFVYRFSQSVNEHSEDVKSNENAEKEVRALDCQVHTRLAAAAAASGLASLALQASHVALRALVPFTELLSQTALSGGSKPPVTIYGSEILVSPALSLAPSGSVLEAIPSQLLSTPSRAPEHISASTKIFSLYEAQSSDLLWPLLHKLADYASKCNQELTLECPKKTPILSSYPPQIQLVSPTLFLTAALEAGFDDPKQFLHELAQGTVSAPLLTPQSPRNMQQTSTDQRFSGLKETSGCEGDAALMLACASAALIAARAMSAGDVAMIPPHLIYPPPPTSMSLTAAITRESSKALGTNPQPDNLQASVSVPLPRATRSPAGSQRPQSSTPSAASANQAQPAPVLGKTMVRPQPGPGPVPQHQVAFDAPVRPEGERERIGDGTKPSLGSLARRGVKASFAARARSLQEVPYQGNLSHENGRAGSVSPDAIAQAQALATLAARLCRASCEYLSHGPTTSDPLVRSNSWASGAWSFPMNQKSGRAHAAIVLEGAAAAWIHASKVPLSPAPTAEVRLRELYDILHWIEACQGYLSQGSQVPSIQISAPLQAELHYELIRRLEPLSGTDLAIVRASGAVLTRLSSLVARQQQQLQQRQQIYQSKPHLATSANLHYRRVLRDQCLVVIRASFVYGLSRDLWRLRLTKIASLLFRNPQSFSATDIARLNDQVVLTASARYNAAQTIRNGLSQISYLTGYLADPSKSHHLLDRKQQSVSRSVVTRMEGIVKRALLELVSFDAGLDTSSIFLSKPALLAECWTDLALACPGCVERNMCLDAAKAALSHKDSFCDRSQRNPIDQTIVASPPHNGPLLDEPPMACDEVEPGTRCESERAALALQSEKALQLYLDAMYRALPNSASRDVALGEAVQILHGIDTQVDDAANGQSLSIRSLGVLTSAYVARAALQHRPAQQIHYALLATHFASRLLGAVIKHINALVDAYNIRMKTLLESMRCKSHGLRRTVVRKRIQALLLPAMYLYYQRVNSSSESCSEMPDLPNDDLELCALLERTVGDAPSIGARLLLCRWLLNALDHEERASLEAQAELASVLEVPRIALPESGAVEDWLQVDLSPFHAKLIACPALLFSASFTRAWIQSRRQYFDELYERQQREFDAKLKTLLSDHARLVNEQLELQKRLDQAQLDLSLQSTTTPQSVVAQNQVVPHPPTQMHPGAKESSKGRGSGASSSASAAASAVSLSAASTGDLSAQIAAANAAAASVAAAANAVRSHLSVIANSPASKYYASLASHAPVPAHILLPGILPSNRIGLIASPFERMFASVCYASIPAPEYAPTASHFFANEYPELAKYESEAIALAYAYHNLPLVKGIKRSKSDPSADSITRGQGSAANISAPGTSGGQPTGSKAQSLRASASSSAILRSRTLQSGAATALAQAGSTNKPAPTAGHGTAGASSRATMPAQSRVPSPDVNRSDGATRPSVSARRLWKSTLVARGLFSAKHLHMNALPATVSLLLARVPLRTETVALPPTALLISPLLALAPVLQASRTLLSHLSNSRLALCQAGMDTLVAPLLCLETLITEVGSGLPSLATQAKLQLSKLAPEPYASMHRARALPLPPLDSWIASRLKSYGSVLQTLMQELPKLSADDAFISLVTALGDPTTVASSSKETPDSQKTVVQQFGPLMILNMLNPEGVHVAIASAQGDSSDPQATSIAAASYAIGGFSGGTADLSKPGSYSKVIPFAYPLRTYSTESLQLLELCSALADTLVDQNELEQARPILELVNESSTQLSKALSLARTLRVQISPQAKRNLSTYDATMNWISQRLTRLTTAVLRTQSKVAWYDGAPSAALTLEAASRTAALLAPWAAQQSENMVEISPTPQTGFVQERIRTAEWSVTLRALTSTLNLSQREAEILAAQSSGEQPRLLLNNSEQVQHRDLAMLAAYLGLTDSEQDSRMRTIATVTDACVLPDIYTALSSELRVLLNPNLDPILAATLTKPSVTLGYHRQRIASLRRLAGISKLLSFLHETKLVTSDGMCSLLRCANFATIGRGQLYKSVPSDIEPLALSMGGFSKHLLASLVAKAANYTALDADGHPKMRFSFTSHTPASMPSGVAIAQSLDSVFGDLLYVNRVLAEAQLDFWPLPLTQSAIDGPIRLLTNQDESKNVSTSHDPFSLSPSASVANLLRREQGDLLEAIVCLRIRALVWLRIHEILNTLLTVLGAYAWDAAEDSIPGFSSQADEIHRFIDSIVLMEREAAIARIEAGEGLANNVELEAELVGSHCASGQWTPTSYRNTSPRIALIRATALLQKAIQLCEQFTEQVLPSSSLGARSISLLQSELHVDLAYLLRQRHDFEARVAAHEKLFNDGDIAPTFAARRAELYRVFMLKSHQHTRLAVDSDDEMDDEGLKVTQHQIANALHDAEVSVYLDKFTDGVTAEFQAESNRPAGNSVSLLESIPAYATLQPESGLAALVTASTPRSGSGWIEEAHAELAAAISILTPTTQTESVSGLLAIKKAGRVPAWLVAGTLSANQPSGALPLLTVVTTTAAADEASNVLPDIGRHLASTRPRPMAAEGLCIPMITGRGPKLLKPPSPVGLGLTGLGIIIASGNLVAALENARIRVSKLLATIERLVSAREHLAIALPKDMDVAPRSQHSAEDARLQLIHGSSIPFHWSPLVQYIVQEVPILLSDLAVLRAQQTLQHARLASVQAQLQAQLANAALASDSSRTAKKRTTAQNQPNAQAQHSARGHGGSSSQNQAMPQSHSQLSASASTVNVTGNDEGAKGSAASPVDRMSAGDVIGSIDNLSSLQAESPLVIATLKAALETSTTTERTSGSRIVVPPSADSLFGSGSAPALTEGAWFRPETQLIDLLAIVLAHALRLGASCDSADSPTRLAVKQIAVQMRSAMIERSGLLRDLDLLLRAALKESLNEQIHSSAAAIRVADVAELIATLAGTFMPHLTARMFALSLAMRHRASALNAIRSQRGKQESHLLHLADGSGTLSDDARATLRKSKAIRALSPIIVSDSVESPTPELIQARARVAHEIASQHSVRAALAVGTTRLSHDAHPIYKVAKSSSRLGEIPHHIHTAPLSLMTGLAARTALALSNKDVQARNTDEVAYVYRSDFESAAHALAEGELLPPDPLTYALDFHAAVASLPPQMRVLQLHFDADNGILHGVLFANASAADAAAPDAALLAAASSAAAVATTSALPMSVYSKALDHASVGGAAFKETSSISFESNSSAGILPNGMMVPLTLTPSTPDPVLGLVPLPSTSYSVYTRAAIRHAALETAALTRAKKSTVGAPHVALGRDVLASDSPVVLELTASEAGAGQMSNDVAQLSRTGAQLLAALTTAVSPAVQAVASIATTSTASSQPSTGQPISARQQSGSQSQPMQASNISGIAGAHVGSQVPMGVGAASIVGSKPAAQTTVVHSTSPAPAPAPAPGAAASSGLWVPADDASATSLGAIRVARVALPVKERAKLTALAARWQALQAHREDLLSEIGKRGAYKASRNDYLRALDKAHPIAIELRQLENEAEEMITQLAEILEPLFARLLPFGINRKKLLFAAQDVAQIVASRLAQREQGVNSPNPVTFGSALTSDPDLVNESVRGGFAAMNPETSSLGNDSSVASSALSLVESANVAAAAASALVDQVVANLSNPLTSAQVVKTGSGCPIFTVPTLPVTSTAGAQAMPVIPLDEGNQALGASLMSEAEESLLDGKDVVILCDESLWSLPWELLPQLSRAASVTRDFSLVSLTRRIKRSLPKRATATAETLMMSATQAVSRLASTISLMTPSSGVQSTTVLATKKGPSGSGANAQTPNNPTVAANPAVTDNSVQAALLAHIAAIANSSQSNQLASSSLAAAMLLAATLGSVTPLQQLPALQLPPQLPAVAVAPQWLRAFTNVLTPGQAQVVDMQFQQGGMTGQGGVGGSISSGSTGSSTGSRKGAGVGAGTSVPVGSGLATNNAAFAAQASTLPGCGFFGMLQYLNSVATASQPNNAGVMGVVAVMQALLNHTMPLFSQSPRVEMYHSPQQPQQNTSVASEARSVGPALEAAMAIIQSMPLLTALALSLQPGLNFTLLPTALVEGVSGASTIVGPLSTGSNPLNSVAMASLLVLISTFEHRAVSSLPPRDLEQNETYDPLTLLLESWRRSWLSNIYVDLNDSAEAISASSALPVISDADALNVGVRRVTVLASGPLSRKSQAPFVYEALAAFQSALAAMHQVWDTRVPYASVQSESVTKNGQATGLPAPASALAITCSSALAMLNPGFVVRASPYLLDVAVAHAIHALQNKSPDDVVVAGPDSPFSPPISTLVAAVASHTTPSLREQLPHEGPEPVPVTAQLLWNVAAPLLPQLTSSTSRKAGTTTQESRRAEAEGECVEDDDSELDQERDEVLALDALNALLGRRRLSSNDMDDIAAGKLCPLTATLRRSLRMSLPLYARCISETEAEFHKIVDVLKAYVFDPAPLLQLTQGVAQPASGTTTGRQAQMQVQTGYGSQQAADPFVEHELQQAGSNITPQQLLQQQQQLIIQHQLQQANVTKLADHARFSQVPSYLRQSSVAVALRTLDALIATKWLQREAERVDSGTSGSVATGMEFVHAIMSLAERPRQLLALLQHFVQESNFAPVSTSPIGLPGLYAQAISGSVHPVHRFTFRPLVSQNPPVASNDALAVVNPTPATPTSTSITSVNRQSSIFAVSLSPSSKAALPTSALASSATLASTVVVFGGGSTISQSNERAITELGLNVSSVDASATQLLILWNCLIPSVVGSERSDPAKASKRPRYQAISSSASGYTTALEASLSGVNTIVVRTTLTMPSVAAAEFAYLFGSATNGAVDTIDAPVLARATLGSALHQWRASNREAVQRHQDMCGLPSAALLKSATIRINFERSRRQAVRAFVEKCRTNYQRYLELRQRLTALQEADAPSANAASASTTLPMGVSTAALTASARRQAAQSQQQQQQQQQLAAAATAAALGEISAAAAALVSNSHPTSHSGFSWNVTTYAGTPSMQALLNASAAADTCATVWSHSQVAKSERAKLLGQGHAQVASIVSEATATHLASASSPHQKSKQAVTTTAEGLATEILSAIPPALGLSDPLELWLEGSSSGSGAEASQPPVMTVSIFDRAATQVVGLGNADLLFQL